MVSEHEPTSLLPDGIARHFPPGSKVIAYTMVRDGEPYVEWTENGRTIRVGETVTIEWGPLAGQSGKILRFVSFRSDAFHVEVELDGTKKLWPINAICYTEEQLKNKPGRWSWRGRRT